VTGTVGGGLRARALDAVKYYSSTVVPGRAITRRAVTVARQSVAAVSVAVLSILKTLRVWAKRWGALFVAVLALLLSVWTARSDQHHKSLSVRPRLLIESFYDEADLKNQKRGWRLHNKGLGPAVVRVFEVYVDDKPQTTWEAFASSLGLPELRSLTHRIGILYSDGIVPAPTVLELFAVGDSAAPDSVARQTGRVRMDLCYCSLYDECWRVSSVRDPVYRQSHVAVAGCDLPKPGQATWIGNSIRR
jgi:hypothetical protein